MVVIEYKKWLRGDELFTQEIPNDIEELSLEDLFMTEVDLSPLTECPRLRSLSLTNRTNESSLDRSHPYVLERLGLDPIPRIKALEELYIRYSRIPELDLTPLAKCKKLRVLKIPGNHLTSFDLTPLAQCKTLTVLDISGHKASHMDLSPLGELPNLMSLSLGGLDEVDLSPLANCRLLRGLTVGVSKQRTIDLSPLEGMEDIIELHLWMPEPNRLDLAPLMSTKYIQTMSLSSNDQSKKYIVDFMPLMTKSIRNLNTAPEIRQGIIYVPRFLRSDVIERTNIRLTLVDMEQWLGIRTWDRNLRVLKHVYSHFGSPLQRTEFTIKMLQRMRLGWLAGVDTELMPLLESAPDDSRYAELQEHLKRELAPIVAKQIGSDGATHFFDPDIMLTEEDYAAIVPDLLARRKKEVEEVTVTYKKEWYSLTPLALTTYGYEVLRALDMKRVTKDISELERRFDELELSLNFSEEQSHTVNLSEGMEKYLISQVKTAGPIRQKRMNVLDLLEGSKEGEDMFYKSLLTKLKKE